MLSSKVRRNIDGDHFLIATRLKHECIFPRITIMRITNKQTVDAGALARRSAAKNDTFYGYNNHEHIMHILTTYY